MDKNFDVYEVQTVLYWIVDVGDFDISGKNYTIELLMITRELPVPHHYYRL